MYLLHTAAVAKCGVRSLIPRGAASLLVVLAAGVDTAAQRSYPDSIISRLRDPRPLVAEEIADVLQATRETMAYKSLRLSASPEGQPGIEHLIGSDGRPVFIRSAGASPDWRTLGPATPLDFKSSVTSVTHYTRRAATRCDGSVTADELVVEYSESSSSANGPGGWSATAHLRKPDDSGGPAFSALTGEIALQDAGRTRLADRRVRAFTDGTQTWWIDEFRLVLLGWSPSGRTEDLLVPGVRPHDRYRGAAWRPSA